MSNLCRCDCDHQNGLNKVRIHWMCLIKSLRTTAQTVVRDSENDGPLINVRNPEERLRSKVRNPEIPRDLKVKSIIWRLVKLRSSNISTGTYICLVFRLVFKYLLCWRSFWPSNQDIVGLECNGRNVQIFTFSQYNRLQLQLQSEFFQIFTATTFDALSVEEIVAG